MKLPEHELIWKEYEKALDFNAAIGLNETVRTNENFFIGKQWEGVEANGLPTPVFNFLKRVVLFTVSGLSSGSIKMAAAPMDGETKRSGLIADVVNDEFVRLFESNKIGALIRQFMRNATVDGDGCLYTYWDPDAVSGHPVSGAIVTEVVENNRVFFGNPNDRRVEKQCHASSSRFSTQNRNRSRTTVSSTSSAQSRAFLQSGSFIRCVLLLSWE